MTTRGAKEELMLQIVEWIDSVLSQPYNQKNIETVRQKVNQTMANYPLFAY
jgi:glycine hydroxymethyltransferase